MFVDDTTSSQLGLPAVSTGVASVSVSTIAGVVVAIVVVAAIIVVIVVVIFIRRRRRLVKIYTVFQKKFTLFVFTITKSDVDQF